MDAAFLAVVIVIVLVPGTDVVITLRNLVSGGRPAAVAAAAGICTAALIQGTLVSLGVGALVVQSRPVFLTLKWAGTLYLFYLAFMALRTALRGHYPPLEIAGEGTGRRSVAIGAAQGFLSNITNPKMFVFYLSLLPQFLGTGASLWEWLVHAWMMPAIGGAWLLLLIALGGAVRGWLMRPRVRRGTDVVAGLALLGFGTKLALSR